MPPGPASVHVLMHLYTGPRPPMNQFLNERPAMAATHKHKLFCNVRRPFQWKTVTNLYYAAKPQDDKHLAAASNQDNYIQYCCYSNRTKIAVPGSISTVVTTATVQTERGQGEEIWDPPSGSTLNCVHLTSFNEPKAFLCLDVSFHDYCQR